MFAFVLFAVFLCHIASITFRRMIEWENRVSCDFVDAFVTFDGENTCGCQSRVEDSIRFAGFRVDSFPGTRERHVPHMIRQSSRKITRIWVTSDSFSLDVSNNCWNRCKLLRFCFSLSTVGSYRTTEGKLVSFETPIDTTAASYGALLGIIDEALLFVGGRGAESLQSVHFSIFIEFLRFYSLCRFPWNVLRQHTLCNSRTWQDLGVGAVLRSFDLRRLGRHTTKVRTLSVQMSEAVEVVPSSPFAVF